MSTREGIVFVGIGRGKVRKGLTRIHMADLLGLSYSDFQAQFAWDNLYAEETAPDSEADDPRRAVDLRERLKSYDAAILLGGRLAKALGCSHEPLHEWFPLADSGVRAARTIPHKQPALEREGAR